MSSEKLTEIEIHLAHQDAQIQTLSDMVTKQWKEIDVLKKRLDRTMAKLGELEATSKQAGSTEEMSVSEIAAMEKPPHY